MTKNETITINETITQRFQSHLYNCIKESNIPVMQLSVSFDREKAYIKDEIAGRIVGEVDMKITIERYEPKKMTRSEVKVEKMEPVKVLEQITKITYPEKMKDVLPMKEFVKTFLEKGYKVEILTHSVSNDLDVVVYKEVEMKE